MSRKIQVISTSADKRRAQIVIKELDAAGVMRSQTRHVSLNKDGSAEIVKLVRVDQKTKKEVVQDNLTVEEMS